MMGMKVMLWRSCSVLLRAALLPAMAWAAVWLRGQVITDARPVSAEPMALRPGEFRGPSAAEVIGACNDAGANNPPDVLDGEVPDSRGRWKVVPAYEPVPASSPPPGR